MLSYKANGRCLSATKKNVTRFILLFFFMASLLIVNPICSNANEVMMNRSWLPVGSAIHATETELFLDIKQDFIDVEPIINFTFSGTWVNELKINNENFRQLRVPGCGATGNIGRPEMPFKGIFVEIPYGVNVSIQILHQETVLLGTGSKIYPVQEPMPDLLGSDAPFFALDADAYAENQWFSESPV